MKLHAINTGYFKLDGGAMFGVVPKSLWQRTNPPQLMKWFQVKFIIKGGEEQSVV